MLCAQVEKLGLDAAVFLRFLRLLRALMLVVSALSLGLLLPINVVYNLRYVPEGERNELSQLTVADVKARWLWAPIAAAYVFSESNLNRSTSCTAHEG